MLYIVLTNRQLFINYSLFCYILHPLIFVFKGNICKDCLGILADGKMLGKKVPEFTDENVFVINLEASNKYFCQQ